MILELAHNISVIWPNQFYNIVHKGTHMLGSTPKDLPYKPMELGVGGGTRDESRGAQVTSPLQRPFKVGDTPGFLPSGLLQVAGIVHVVKDGQHFSPASVLPALAFAASLGHTSTYEDAASFSLLRPDACSSLQGDVQSGDPLVAFPLNCSTLLPLSAFLHDWRDLPGVLPWILHTIHFGLHTPPSLLLKTKSESDVTSGTVQDVR